MAYPKVWVKPTPEADQAESVAFWEMDDPELGPEGIQHGRIDPRWIHPITGEFPFPETQDQIGTGKENPKGFGGAYICGDKRHPGKVYPVANTPYLQSMLGGKHPLIMLADEPVTPTPVTDDSDNGQPAKRGPGRPPKTDIGA